MSTTRSSQGSHRTDVNKRGPQGIYQRRRKSSSGQVCAGGTAEDQAVPASVVNLRSTLELFGVPTFKVQSYIERRVGQAKNETAHKQELMTRKSLLNGALKTFVTDHYQMFIHTSKEIEYIESDLSNLHNTLSQYKLAVKRLQDISLSDDVILPDSLDKANASKTSNMNTNADAMLQETIDELSTLMYERKLDQAVTTIDAAYARIGHDLNNNELIASRAKLNTERDKIVELASDFFKTPSLKSSERRRYINCIVRLGHLDKAMSLFFEQRGSLLRTAQSQIRSTGDLTSFITDLSGIVFSSIGTSWIEFKRTFRHAARSSAFYMWNLSELQLFGNIIKNQVFRPGTAFRTICQCIHLSMLACKMLEKQGIKSSFILEKLIIPDLRTAFQAYLVWIRQTISKEISAENWEIEQAWVRQSTAAEYVDKLSITRSARNLYDIIHQFILDTKLVIFNPALFNPTVNDLMPMAINGVRNIFEGYLLQMATASKSDTITDKESIAIIANSYYLAEDLYLRLIKQLTPRLQKQRGFSELTSFHERLVKFYKSQRDFFAPKRVESWIRDIIKWKSSFQWYSPSDAPVLSPSPGFLAFAKYLEDLRFTVNEIIPVTEVLILCQ